MYCVVRSVLLYIFSPFFSKSLNINRFVEGEVNLDSMLCGSLNKSQKKIESMGDLLIVIISDVVEEALIYFLFIIDDVCLSLTILELDWISCSFILKQIIFSKFEIKRKLIQIIKKQSIFL